MPKIDERKKIEIVDKYVSLIEAELAALERGEDPGKSLAAQQDQEQAAREQAWQEREAAELQGLHGLSYTQRKRFLTEQRRAEERQAQAKAQARAEAEAMAAKQQADNRLPGDYIPASYSLEASYRAELEKIRPGDAGRIAELKQEYRRKGLQVY